MDETPTPATGDDYSYDLAHDVPPPGTHPAQARRRASGAPAGGTRPDEVGDYSYDLAHEVPPARREDR